MSNVPPENRRAEENVPPENQAPEVDMVGGIPSGFERLLAPGAISLTVGITEVHAAGVYTLANGTRDGQEKVIITRLEGGIGGGIDYDFAAQVHCRLYIGPTTNYDPATTGMQVSLVGPMTTLHLKWTVGIPTQDWGDQDCWVIVGGPGLNQFDTGTSLVSELQFYRGTAPS